MTYIYRACAAIDHFQFIRTRTEIKKAQAIENCKLLLGIRSSKDQRS